MKYNKTEQNGPARQVTELIAKNDRLVDLFSIDIKEAGPGKATLTMRVGKQHLNAAGFCHGAAIFALADIAFALAANCHGPMALALECAINYFRPAKPGTLLTASATQLHQGRQTGFFTVSITDDQDRPVAMFKSTSFQISDSESLEQVANGTGRKGMKS